MSWPTDLVSPTGTIVLYRDVPLNKNYAHSIYFDTKQSRLDYFATKQIANATFNNQNYVKTETGKIRVQTEFNNRNVDIDDACYMSWRNSNSGNTQYEDFGTDATFYAFITDVSMVSLNVVEISYELDVLMTYVIQNRVSFGECYIDRRHFLHARDNPTVNLEPESISIRQKKLSKAGVSASDNFLLQSTAYDSSEDADLDTLLVFTSKFIDPHHTYASDADTARAWNGDKHGNLRQGLFVEVIKPTEAGDFFAEIYDNMQDYADAIVGIVAVPNFMASHRDNNNPLYKDDDKYRYSHAINLAWNKGMDGVSESDIKNKKLFTAPYNTLILTDGVNQLELEYEYIGPYQTAMSNFVELYYTTILSIQPDAKIQFIMENYNRNMNDTDQGLDMNLLSTCLMADLQRIPWVTSAYSQWMANNSIGAGVNALSSMGSGALAGLAAGGPAGAIMGAVGGGALSLLGNAAGGIGTSLIQAPSVKGQSSANNMIALGKYNVHAYRSSLSREDVERIDDYFTMFGYACNRIANPFNSVKNVITGSGSLNQCYIKTTGCITVEGNCPAEYMRRIEDIFDKGITWWKSGDVIGTYN